jgi:hypothetical protein
MLKQNKALYKIYDSQNVDLMQTEDSTSLCSLTLQLGKKFGDFKIEVEGFKKERLEILKITIDGVKKAAKDLKVDQDLLDLIVACEALSSLTRRLAMKEATKIVLPQGAFNHLAQLVDQKIEELGVAKLLEFCKTEELHQGIVAISCPFGPLLCAMFMRPEAHYEDPTLAGEIFSREECAKNYVQNLENRPKEFSYYFDWGGFNFPDSAIRPFAAGSFGQLSIGEQALIELLNPQLSKSEPFYVIAYSGDPSDPKTKNNLQHETLHGLFYTNKEYHDLICELLRSDAGILLLTPCVHQFLKECSYHTKVWQDELHAYLGGSTEALLRKDIKLSDELAKLLPAISKKIQDIAYLFLKNKDLVYID